MKNVILVCSLLCVLVTACVTTRTPPVLARTGPLQGDEQLIQGSWVVVHHEMSHMALPEMKGRVHIYFGRQFRLDTDAGSEAFRIDEQCEPKRIDFDDGHRPLMQGIYKLEADRLTVCVGAPGRGRPTTFNTRFGDQSLLTILERAPAK